VANEQHLSILEKGRNAWNKWRDENKNIRPDLTDIAVGLPFDLRGFNLYRVNFSESTLDRVILEKAMLREANLTGASLNGCNLRRANLIKADLRDSDLRGADFSHAKLEEAMLSGAILGFDLASTEDNSATRFSIIYSDFSGAHMKSAKLQRVMLRSSQSIDEFGPFGAISAHPR
jgi:uncharacterized protein YjbI with pentapeptide repeats